MAVIGRECSQFLMIFEMDIENVTKFCDFYKALVLQSLWNGNFFELADNGLLGCMAVVGAPSQKS